jgi:hypothetical protein
VRLLLGLLLVVATGCGGGREAAVADESLTRFALGG